MHWIKVVKYTCLLISVILLFNNCAKRIDQIRDPVKSLPYSKEELLSRKIRDTYEGAYLFAYAEQSEAYFMMDRCRLLWQIMV